MADEQSRAEAAHEEPPLDLSHYPVSEVVERPPDFRAASFIARRDEVAELSETLKSLYVKGDTDPEISESSEEEGPPKTAQSPAITVTDTDAQAGLPTTDTEAQAGPPSSPDRVGPLITQLYSYSEMV